MSNLNNECRICSLTINAIDEDYITVTVPTKHISKLSSSTTAKFIINWNTKNIINYFHHNCWNSATKKKLTRSEQTIVNKVTDTIEKFQCEKTINNYIDSIVNMLVNAKRTVVFTGSGISAAAGIPTYRGATGIDTLLSLSNNDNNNFSDYNTLQPTASHYAINKMYDLGLINGCFTQNCDDLHAKAGLPREVISDLHGNVYVEYCEKCLTEYVRDYAVDEYSTDCYNESYYAKCPDCQYNHYTGRLCDDNKCKGKLRDTIVNFGDSLHDKVCGGLTRAAWESRRADVCLCLGTSLTVPPASDLPLKAKKLVIVNLQDTDCDDDADVRLWTTTDKFFQLLMPKLEQALSNNNSSSDSNKRRKVMKQPKRTIDLTIASDDDN